jgi:serine/threonine protein phosphatase PrpC
LKFIEDIVKQEQKNQQIVCGDFFLSHRTLETTIFILCDGIGSGVYANIAAITCANRLLQLFQSGVSMQEACTMVAASMEDARKTDIPFSAFTAVKILKDGQFTVYGYEVPSPLMIEYGSARVLKSTYHQEGTQIIAESSGVLDIGDSLIILSDGVTQAGLGLKYPLGIGEAGISKFINKEISSKTPIDELPDKILALATTENDGTFHDDTTVAVLNCRQAKELVILTGPPSTKLKDREVVDKFINMPGIHAVCGSTTADIVSRELTRKIEIANRGRSIGVPPEYLIEGIDIVSEGAIVLNQVFNILEEDPELFTGASVVEKLCSLLHDADSITIMVGMAVNEAHTDLSFKQLGVRPRHITVNLIADVLRKKGKLVTIETY